jgi:hypothetical protein
MTVDIYVYKMTENKIPLGKMTVEKMSVEEMTVDKMSVEEMTPDKKMSLYKFIVDMYVI